MHSNRRLVFLVLWMVAGWVLGAVKQDFKLVFASEKTPPRLEGGVPGTILSPIFLTVRCHKTHKAQIYFQIFKHQYQILKCIIDTEYVCKTLKYKEKAFLNIIISTKMVQAK